MVKSTFARPFFALITALAAMAALLSGASASAAPSSGGAVNRNGPHCDRQCLQYTMTLWTEAVLTNDPALGGFANLRISPKVKVTDKGNPSAIGKGALWGKVSRFQFRETWVDETSQSVFFYGTATNAPAAENATAPFWWYVVRLKLHHGQITEVEEIDQQIGTTGFGAPARTLQEPDPLLHTPLAKEQQTSRAAMIRAVDSYWDALGRTTPGRGYTGLFSPDCVRNENGNYTSNQNPQSSCVSSLFYTPPPAVPGFTWNIDNRRYYVVDVETGIVAGIGMFHAVPGANRSFAVPEVFKIEDGLIRKMFAVFNLGDPTRNQVDSGWPDYTYPGLPRRS